MAGFQFGDGCEVHAGVVTDGSVRASTGFHAEDAVSGKSVVADEELGVFAGVNVVGDDRHRKLATQVLAKT